MIFTLFSALTILMIFFIQTLLVTYFPVIGLAPSLILLGLMIFSLRYGSAYGAIFGFFSGIMLDVFTSRLFGFEALVFTTLGYLCGLLNRRLDESMIKVQHLTSFSLCFVYYFIAGAVLNLLTAGVFALNVWNAAGCLVYTVLLTYPFYRIFNYWAERIEIWSGKENQV